ncbi:galactokinase [Nocardioides donggukensis]|uniref:Galactokinase n=1 Tax=Nocardioides donggukensis TaxID=2774019 RepID=A0A927K2I1_9ACTN|nr:galactokinase [Nocardioides donggukensis]MBD8868834.1 galactokinase [Nocardioides donggukensis]
MTTPEPARRASATFVERHGGDPDGVWFAPGRVNLIGEHTDYNEGFVLPLALAQGVGVAARRRADGVLRVTSRQLEGAEGTVECAVADLAPGAVSGWGAYPAGVAWALREAGHPVTGADLVLDSDVPPGAGLSSSHALECAVAVALLGLSEPDPTTLDRTALARLVRTAENDFVGAPTGIMDQMASLHGVADHALFIDTRSLAVEPVPFDPGANGLALLVLDTRTEHALVDGEYADRRAACAAGAAALGVAALRDVAADDLATLEGRIGDPVVRRRVRHVVTEDARVLSTVERLRAGADLRSIGTLLTASHASMRDDFEITVPQVDLAVHAALAAGAHGARMTGGGFGGCVLALVEAEAIDDVAQAVRAAYAGAGFTAPVPVPARPSAGARRVS